jgi:hypothetical protein
MRNNKYLYTKVIQQYYGQGWEDASEYKCNSLGNTIETCTTKDNKIVKTIKLDLKEYRLLGYPTRVIFRKEKNTNN